MSERSKMIAADLVYIPADRIQEAMDFLIASRSAGVSLLVFNGLCIGIDTAKPPKDSPKSSEMAQPRLMQLPAPKGSDKSPAQFDRQNIINIIEQAGKPITAFDIGGALGLATNDKSKRARMTYLLGMLKRDRVLHRNANGAYSMPKRPETPKHHSPDRVTRDQITEDAVLAIITKMEKANASLISEAFNVPVNDASVRNKVSVTLASLRNNNRIVPIEDGKSPPRGGIFYSLATAPSTP